MTHITFPMPATLPATALPESKADAPVTCWADNMQGMDSERAW